MNYNNLCSCHEQKKRCPICKCLETKKYGFINSFIKTSRGIISKRIQRFYCKSCCSTFTTYGKNKRKKISDRYKLKIVKEYALSHNSLRDISKNHNVGKSSILNWLKEISKLYPEIHYNLESIKSWSGLILIDGKEIKNNGTKKVLFIASDAINKQPIYYSIFEKESSYYAEIFLTEIKKTYPVKIRGITTDFGKGKCFLNVVKKVFPNIPHQICLVHYLRYVWLFLPRTKRSEFYFRNIMLKHLIKLIIKSSTREESLFWLKKLNHFRPFFRAEYHKRFLKSINKNYEDLTRYYDYNFIPTNTNVIENLNRQLERKIKNLDGIKSIQNFNSLLKIWFFYYKIRHN